MVLAGIRNGIDLVRQSIRVFAGYPRLVAPLLLTWIVYAPIAIYLRFFFDPSGWSMGAILGLAFGVVFLFALLLAFACSMLMELIEHIETGQDPDLAVAFRDTVSRNLVSLVPIVVVWSLIWFLISVVQALLEDDDAGGDYSAESAARTLAGDGPSSLLGLSLDALKKGVRMVVFLIIPAIAWEDRGFWDATKRGFSVLRSHVGTFATGFSLTWLITALVFLPPTILFKLSDEGLVAVPEWGWYLVIAYIGMAWSYSLYLEQMFVAGLFLWHRNWEEAAAAREQGEPEPTLRDVRQPSLFDSTPDLVERRARKRPKD